MPAPSKSSADFGVTLSVLDRLMDKEPDQSSEGFVARAQSIRELKAAVRRDLERLLNTRRIAVEPEESLQEVNRSVYIYGLPDFTAMGLASRPEKVKLLRSLQATIKMFEPRLTNVRIVPLEVPGVKTNTLRFRIEALLLMDPAPEQISFDTFLDLTRSECRIQRDVDAR